MTPSQITSNPFAQMMDPQAVIAAVERSERLQRLQSRVCRPLDKVFVGPEAGEEAVSFDASVESAEPAEDQAEGEAQNVTP